MALLRYVFLAGLLAVSQAGVALDGVSHVQRVASDYKVKTDYFEDLAKELRLGVEEQALNLRRLLDDNAQQHLSNALRRSEVMECAPETKDHLVTVRESWEERIKNCIELTQTLVDMENFIYNSTKQVTELEDTICMIIQNITACSKQSWYDEVECIVSEVEKSMDEFHNNEFINGIIAELKDIAVDATDHFKKCFLKVSSEVGQTMSEVVKAQCQPARPTLVGFH